MRVAAAVPADPVRLFRRRLRFTLIQFSGAVFGTALVLFLLIRTLSSEVALLKRQRGEYRWLLWNSDAVAALNVNREAARAMEGRMEQAFPLALEVPVAVVPYIQNRALAHRVESHVTLGALGTVAVGGFPEVSLTVSAQGTLGDLTAFLLELERGSPIIRFSSADLTAAAASPTPRYTLTIDGVVSVRQ